MQQSPIMFGLIVKLSTYFSLRCQLLIFSTCPMMQLILFVQSYQPIRATSYDDSATSNGASGCQTTPPAKPNRLYTTSSLPHHRPLSPHHFKPSIHPGPSTPLRHVVPIDLPCRDSRRPPCQLRPSSHRPVPGADPNDSGCRPCPQLRHYI